MFLMWTPRRSSARKDITLTNQALDYKDSSRVSPRLVIPRLINVDKMLKDLTRE